jgi:hypothetical protein
MLPGNVVRSLHEGTAEAGLAGRGIYMGTVSRRLCFEHAKILLHAEGKYWIANLKSKDDRLLFEKRSRRLTHGAEGFLNRRRMEFEVAIEGGFPIETIYRLRKQIRKAAKWA